MESLEAFVQATGGYPVHCVHRGGAPEVGPENTMWAFRRCVALGARLLETDVRLTRDAQLVLMHDARVDRCTDGQGFVCDLTLAELRELDAAYQTPQRGQGIRVPTLQEFLDEFATNANLMLMLDFKDVQSVLAARPVVEAFWPKLQHRLLLGSVFDDANQVLRAQWPTVPLLMSVARVFRITIAYHTGLLQTQHFDSRDVFGYILREETRGFWTRDFVQALHDRGCRVMVCGSALDTEEGLRQQMQWGVDFVMTDRPDVMQRILAKEWVCSSRC